MFTTRSGMSAAILAILATPAAAADIPEAFQTGPKLAARLDAPLTATWLNVELRTMAGRISENRRVAVVIDRRIDPNRLVTLESRNEPLRLALSELADDAGAAVSVTHIVVYIGPPESAGRLRTLIQLRSDELDNRASAGTTGPKPGTTKSSLPRRVLADRSTFVWEDLDEPRGIVQRIATRWKLTPEGLDRIPHDLWAAATLPETSAAEALSLVLNQFDLTFEWTDGGTGFRILPIEGEPRIERRYMPRGTKAAEVAARWSEEIDGLVATAEGAEIRVRGTVEQHEAVQERLKPGSTRPAASGTGKRPVGTPLRRRTFTLRTQDVPASAVIQKLVDSGLTIRYDAERLKTAGVDLEKRIALDLNKASVEELLDAICKPVGLKHRIEGETITLLPP